MWQTFGPVLVPRLAPGSRSGRRAGSLLARITLWTEGLNELKLIAVGIAEEGDAGERGFLVREVLGQDVERHAQARKLGVDGVHVCDLEGNVSPTHATPRRTGLI